MQRYEYRVIPAPKKGKKAKGLRTGEARFANALTDCMNDMAADGWEYQRTDTLPSEERSGFTGKTTIFQNMLVFRRAVNHSTAVAGAVAESVTITPTILPADFSDVHAPKLPSASQAQDVTASDAARVSHDNESSEPRIQAAE